MSAAASVPAVTEGFVDILVFSSGRSAFDLRRVGCDRFAFLRALVVRADFFPSTSAETSNVTQTRFPVLCGRILMTRFDMGFVRVSCEAIRVPVSFRAGRPNRKADGYRTVRPLSNPFQCFALWLGLARAPPETGTLS
jgi:hypothetical protein